ncbi:WxL domain-containing protein [Lapidilactobacillus dextrinicus]|nr:WxL domain-containing protein [Lapidilactobacillus dextrinicus]
MKFTKLMTVSSLALLLAVTGVGATQASAATDDTTATTTAEFSIENGTLTLDKAPDLQFGKVNIADVLSGKTTSLSLANNSVSKQVAGETTAKAPTEGVIQVTNYDATVASWNLTAKATAFDGMTGVKMNIAPQNVKTTNGSKTAATSTPGSDSDVINDAVDVLDGAPAMGVTTADVKKDDSKAAATLDLSGVKDASQITTGTHQSTVTWTLSSTAPANAAK